MISIHQPVLLEEVISHLNLRKGGTYIDLTLGAAGHSLEILERLEGDAHLIGVDRDEEILNFAQQKLENFPGKFTLCHDSFSNIREILLKQQINHVDGVLMDIGVSSWQLDQGQRGFSFNKEGPLDMRMDISQALTAEKVVNTYPEHELANIIYLYGEEHRSRQIAREIVSYRGRKKIRSTLELANIVQNTLKYRGKIHPATKTFQALRIEVNQELQQLQTTLGVLPSLLKDHGRAVVICFHSLEDRIAKHTFKNKEIWKALTKKPIVASREEMKKNPRSRSAKLRCAEKPSGAI
ncbi:16S rRNA (cytosine(1402)-N(4))-methyltransferase RsmH [Candidatus Uabimicrobium sp. HlEnr_7]|uniref:16S rRNA (cytosine(1402)-N(4))-methyltransferase RsmH n=1 Tax=Candidatus Uabimicrobium helgolandensis TaxID=3095367 RepID=UPI0035590B5E